LTRGGKHFPGDCDLNFIQEALATHLLLGVDLLKVRAAQLEGLAIRPSHGPRTDKILAAFSEVPKPMAKIGGQTLLWHIRKIYSSFGIN
jgi:hypothetical protein